MTKIEYLRAGATVTGIEPLGTVELTRSHQIGEGVMLVEYRASTGDLRKEFLTRHDERSLNLEAELRDEPARFYPSGVPSLFESATELHPLLERVRSRKGFHPVAQAYIGEVARRLSLELTTVPEIYAVAGARNDALSAGGGREILWEVFGTHARVEEDWRKLERDREPRRLKVAVVLDREVDQKLFDKFIRAQQGSSVRTWFRVTDLMLRSRFEHVVQLVDKELAALEPEWPDQLEFQGLRLADGHRFWRKYPDLPFAFSLDEHETFEPIEDLALELDIRNSGSRESRITHARAEVRFRQTKLHGLPGDDRLRPTAEVVIPIDRGAEGVYEVELPEPILLGQGVNRRLVVRLAETGFAWRGEIELSLRYGERRILRTPAISIFA